LRILIIEDSKVQQSFYQSFLEGKGYETHYVETAEDGLDALKDFEPEAIILDYFLPGMDAPDFLLEIHIMGLNVPVIVATASDKKEEKTKCILQGANAFLRKPFNEESLISDLERAIENFRLQDYLTSLNFSDSHLDFLLELSNIGLGVGAEKLGNMVEMVIKLKVPSVKIIPQSEFANLPIMGFEQLVYMQMNFSGDLEGACFLILSLKDAESLVQLLGVDQDIKDEAFQKDLLKEVGNIVLNSVFGTLSNKFKTQLKPQLPQYFKCSPEKIIENLRPYLDENGEIIYLSSVFEIMGLQFGAKISLVFKQSSLGYLKVLIDEALIDDKLDNK